MATNTLLIDGDIICYTSAAAAQKSSILVYDEGHILGEFKNITECRANVVDLDKYQTEVLVYPEPLAHALHNVKRAIGRIQERYPKHETVVLLSDAPTYRDMLATFRPYKGHRDPSLKPVHLNDCKAYISDMYKTGIMKHLEADDAIGILADEESVVCSTDKDLDQIPGKHYNFSKDVGYDVSHRDALLMLYKQMFSGDSTDNIPGIEGVGDKTAYALALEAINTEDPYAFILSVYIDKYGNEEGFARYQETYFLVKICRSKADVNALRAIAESKRHP